MTRLLPLLLLAPALAAGAPVPKESDAERVARFWGKVVSPEGKYVTKLTGDSLTLRTTGKPLLFFGMEAPRFRVVRQFSGDFVARVKLASLDAPSRSAKYLGGMPVTFAGLYVEGGGYSLSVFRRREIPEKDDGTLADTMRDVVWWGSAEPGTSGIALWAERESDTPTDLRIVRKGASFVLYFSNDGKVWESMPAPEGMKFPTTVAVSVFLGHSTYQECQATFSDYAVEKLEEK